MIDLTTIPADTLTARGEYATVRGAHEDAKKELVKLGGELQSVISRIARRVQADSDDVPESVADLFVAARALIEQMDACVTEIESLAQQRAALRPIAWGRK